MLRMRSNVAAGVALAAWLAPVVVAQPCHGQVLINEVLGDPGVDWNGDGTVSFRDDEWVEIVNSGPAPVTLDDYRLSDGGTPIMRFGFSGTLAPGDVKVVYGSTSVAWESANGLPASGLSLNNAGDTVQLWQITSTDTVLADSYTYAGFEILDDRSVGRMPDGASEWRLFDRRTPYTGMTPPLGTGCEPTPGSGNSCPTGVESTPWTRIKRLYRDAEGDTPRGRR